MKALQLINMIHVAKATCLIDTKEQCAVAWDRVEEVSAHRARKIARMRPDRTVIFNKDKLDKIKKNTLKIRRAEKKIAQYKKEIYDMYLLDESFFINI